MMGRLSLVSGNRVVCFMILCIVIGTDTKIYFVFPSLYFSCTCKRTSVGSVMIQVAKGIFCCNHTVCCGCYVTEE